MTSVSLRPPEPAVLALPEDGPRLPIGVIVLDRAKRERVVELIAADMPLPQEYRGRFGYAYENMTAVRLEITVGPGSTREEVRVVGKLELTGLPPRPRGTPIEVVILHTGDALQVRLSDPGAGESRDATIGLDP